jgi:hypothetical protein
LPPPAYTPAQDRPFLEPHFTGTRLGPYDIPGLIGAGREGHKARDTRLKRDVALKILAVAVATDRDRLARFSARGNSSPP